MASDRVQWNDEESRHSGQLQIQVHGKLRLNPAFSSSEQGPFNEGTDFFEMSADSAENLRHADVARENRYGGQYPLLDIGDVSFAVMGKIGAVV